MHITLEQVPSKYIPYSDEVRQNKIKIRPLTYGEVLAFSQHKDKFIDLLDYMKTKDIVTGVPFEEITIGDWEFIELSLVAISYADPTYTIDLGQCEVCKQKFSDLPEEELYLKVGPHTISKIPALLKKVKFGEINFKELENEITSVGEVTLEDGTVATVDFYRLKHFKTLLQENKEESVARKVELVTNTSVDNITTTDFVVLNEAITLMEHGLDSTFVIKCPNGTCNNKKEVSFQWRLLQLRTFSVSDDVIRNRISFGKTSKPVPIARQELPRSQSTLRPAS